MREEIARQLMEKVRGDYDAIADAFSASRTEVWPEMRRFVDRVLPGAHVLDVGCGNGRAYQLFEGMAIEYEGLDVSEKLIAHARKNVMDQLATFRVGSMTALPYEAATFDAVLAIAVLHHVPSRELRLTALREAHRVLKRGGWLLMTNWDRWKPRHARELLAATAKKLLGMSPYDFKDVFIPWRGGGAKVDRYYHAFTRGELRRLCLDAGFTVVEHYYTAKGARASWWNGDNLITICRKA